MPDNKEEKETGLKDIQCQYCGINSEVYELQCPICGNNKINEKYYAG